MMQEGVAVDGSALSAVEGVVVELGGGPVAGAVVRQQTAYTSTTSRADGTLVIITGERDGFPGQIDILLVDP